MGLSLREKQLFYDQLGKLLRAGIPISGALEKLSLTAHGSLRQLLRSLRERIAQGDPVGEAFQNARPALSDLERVTLAGLARSGHMETGLDQLSAYFGVMHRARGAILQRLAYPIFLLHFALLALNAQLLVTAGVDGFLKRVGITLVYMYGALLAAAMLVGVLRDAGSFLPPIDDLLRRLPFVGKVRRSFALSRFCATYNMQLDAGINVVESLQAAARASRSALIRSAVSRAAPDVRRGEQVGPLLARSSSALPRELMRAFMVAEETGQLDRMLAQSAADFQEDAFRRMDIAAEWLPRLFYVGTMVYIAWRIVSWYQGYMKDVMSQSGALFGG